MTRILTALLICTLLISCDQFIKSESDKIIYFPNSKIVKQHVQYKNKRKHGLFKEYYRNGNPKAIQHYRNDTLTDTSFFYHKNGVLGSFQIVENNKKQGCWKKFNKQGKMYWKACFKDGELDGVSEEYTYKSIQLLVRLRFSEGRKDGLQETFYPNGNKQSLCYFAKGMACPGTEEWTSSGKKIDNDFKINVQEKNEVFMKDRLTFYIRLENPQSGDQVYEVLPDESAKKITTISHLTKEGDYYLMNFYVPKGAFVMREIHLAAFRKTGMGNTFIKRTKFMASANHF